MARQPYWQAMPSAVLPSQSTAVRLAPAATKAAAASELPHSHATCSAVRSSASFLASHLHQTACVSGQQAACVSVMLMNGTWGDVLDEQTALIRCRSEQQKQVRQHLMHLCHG